jgi:hypothetical protein
LTGCALSPYTLGEACACGFKNEAEFIRLFHLCSAGRAEDAAPGMGSKGAVLDKVRKKEETERTRKTKNMDVSNICQAGTPF